MRISNVISIMRLVGLAFLLVICSCAVGPDYQKPDVTNITPPDWRWKVAEPKDSLPKGAWWKVFNDPVLDKLEVDAVEGNQNLRSAVARVDEARAFARLSRSRFFPELTLDPLFRRERTSGNQPFPIPFELPSMHLNTFSVPIDLSYEVDLWGRVRRSFEAAQSQAQASVSDYQNVLLTLTADVALNYFLIRAFDAEIDTLKQTVALRDEAVRIQHQRFIIGTIAEMDVERARTELARAKADLSDITRLRTETLHSLALLCGKPAGSFEVATQEGINPPPLVPAGIPSSLLERRPDIARAERNLAAMNANIGVAKSAYFPALRLTGQAGYLSTDAGDLFSSDSRVWSIGPGISLPLFTGGRTAAGVKQAEATYQETLAQYRQTVLVAFKEVEDSLMNIVLRNEEYSAQIEALVAAERVAALVRTRYDAGAVSYLEVVDSERTMLEQKRRAARLEGVRFAASVRLIKSLGGGW